MTWHDELRELEARLAEGTMSAADFRAARDEVLRRAQSGDAGESATPGQTDDQRPDPFGQPFRWASQSTWDSGGTPRSDEPDQTQVVPDTPGSDTTQRVVRSDPGAWTVARPPGQPGPPWPPAPGTQRPSREHSEFDAVAQPSTGWMMQGSETFENLPAHGRRIRVIAVAAVLLVGLAVAGVLHFVNRSPEVPGTGAAPTTTTTSSGQLPEPPATKRAPVDTAGALVDPPGRARGGGGSLDLESLRAKNLLPEPVVTALETARMTDGILKTTVLNNLTLGMYALAVKSDDDARTVAHAYAKVQREGGLPANAGLSMHGVPVYATPDRATNHVFRAVYVLYKRVVIVEVFGPNRQDAQSTFTELLRQQVDNAPPTLRPF